MTKYILIQTTIDCQEKAKEIATYLIEKKTAACVQIEGPISSYYMWENKQETTTEWRLTIKTNTSLYDRVEENILEKHTYDTPEIIATSIENGYPPYLNWIDSSVN